MRIFLPTFFFVRRFMTAMLLVMTDKVVVQFMSVIIFSFTYFLYLASQEPYVRRTTNGYLTALELLYFILTGISLLLTDASADIASKALAAKMSVVLLMIFVLANIIVTIRLARLSRSEHKAKDKENKERRRENDRRRIIERQVKEERAKRRE